MSVELYVFLESATLPDRDAWQHAINRAGHDLILDQHLQPRKNSGFVPVSYRGGATGFELDTGPSSDLVADMPPEAADFIGSGRDICVSFRVGADACELIAASIAASVLTELSGGVLYDEAGLIGAGDARAWAQHLIAGVKDLCRLEKTDDTWPAAVLALVRECYADYTLNTLGAPFGVECLRRVEGGWYFSQNTVRVHNTDHHCFALLLAPAIDARHLYSPYVAGGRFNHSYAIGRAFEDQLGLGPRNQIAPAACNHPIAAVLALKTLSENAPPTPKPILLLIT